MDASENFAGAQKNTAESGVKYSIRNDIVDANGTEYDRVVELEYSLFNKVKRNGKAYIDFIRNNLIKQKIAVYSNSGEVEIIEFAGEKERVQKDGAKKHPVIGELTQAKNEIKKLVILNSAETAEISKFAQHRKEHTHQWLDENGWDERISHVMTRDGIVYPAILHIAKTKDGRNILYDINVKIRKGVAADKNATSLRAKSKQGRRSEPQRLRLKLGYHISNWVSRRNSPIGIRMGIHSPRGSRNISRILGFRIRTVICWLCTGGSGGVYGIRPKENLLQQPVWQRLLFYQ